jgi:phage repressor protein C with HTH and peptisase S24 domain
MEYFRQEKNDTLVMVQEFQFGYQERMEWHERVKTILSERGLRQADIEKTMEMQQSTMSKYLSGERGRDSISTARRFSRALRVPLCELLGEPYHTIIKSPPTLQIQKVDRFKRFDDTFSSESYIPIRLLEGAAAAGSPTEVLDYEPENAQWVLIYASREWMPNNPEDYTCVKVSGQSMYPILSDGDIVAVDHAVKDPAVLDGKMAVFRIDGGITIKWLKYKKDLGVVVGIPENRDELDHVVMLSGPQINTGIVGKVAWWWSKR